MRRLTLFTFGYDGWGGTTEQLVCAVDAVEAKRGFRSPIFVDVRIRRAVRAKGFIGAAFGKRVGQGRYCWMPDLGNRSILMRSGPAIQIAAPSAARDLLALAVEAARRHRRVIFFCRCKFPRWDGQVKCHRTAVATLVLRAARAQKRRVEIVEWPGGTVRPIDVPVSVPVFRALVRGRSSIPLGHPGRLAAVAGLAWGSIATMRSGAEVIHRLVGPAMWRRGEWCLPALWRAEDPAAGLSVYRRKAAVLRRSRGYEPRRSA